MKFFQKDKKKVNTDELIILTLKAELYDKNEEIRNLKEQLKRERQIVNKIKTLPTAKKRELGIL
jgi:hypothetical protein